MQTIIFLEKNYTSFETVPVVSIVWYHILCNYSCDVYADVIEHFVKRQCEIDFVIQ